MSDEDAAHPLLGVLRLDNDDGWVGSNRAHADAHDLYIMRPQGYDDEAPPPSAVARLVDAVREIDALKAEAVAAVCAARMARLNWRAGPELELWSLVEARIDQHGAAWLSLHEYETDEYSLWLVKTEGSRESWIVRRRPWTPYNGAPDDAGHLV